MHRSGIRLPDSQTSKSPSGDVFVKGEVLKVRWGPATVLQCSR